MLSNAYMNHGSRLTELFKNLKIPRLMKSAMKNLSYNFVSRFLIVVRYYSNVVCCCWRRRDVDADISVAFAVPSVAESSMWLRRRKSRKYVAVTFAVLSGSARMHRGIYLLEFLRIDWFNHLGFSCMPPA